MNNQDSNHFKRKDKKAETHLPVTQNLLTPKIHNPLLHVTIIQRRSRAQTQNERWSPRSKRPCLPPSPPAPPHTPPPGPQPAGWAQSLIAALSPGLHRSAGAPAAHAGAGEHRWHQPLWNKETGWMRAVHVHGSAIMKRDSEIRKPLFPQHSRTPHRRKRQRRHTEAQGYLEKVCSHHSYSSAAALPGF